jgi:hypothetical protein
MWISYLANPRRGSYRRNRRNRRGFATFFPLESGDEGLMNAFAKLQAGIEGAPRFS